MFFRKASAPTPPPLNYTQAGASGQPAETPFQSARNSSFSSRSASSDGAPENLPPPPPERHMTGSWNAIKRKLGVAEGPWTFGPFGSCLANTPTGAHTKTTVTPANRHRHQPDATTPAAVRKQVANTAASAMGARPGPVPGPGLPFSDAGAATAAIAARFAPAEPHGLGAMLRQTGADELAQHLVDTYAVDGVDGTDGADRASYARALMLGRVLAGVADGDPVRARNALAVLEEGGGAAALDGDAFDAARELARTPRGVALLETLAPAPSQAASQAASQVNPPADAEAAEIAAQAVLHGLRAANQLLAVWPADLAPPRSLADVVARAAHLAQSADTAPSLKQAANALLCAHTLRTDPGAAPPSVQRAAYLAWRNELTEAGPGSDLERLKQRLAKLATYTERASASTPRSWLANAFGFQKSPLAALGFGTGGAEFRHPDDDFAEMHAIPELATHCRAGAQALAGRSDAVPLALKGALLDCWYRRIAQHGYQPDARVDRAMRREIVKEVSAQLGLRESTIRGSLGYRQLRHAPLTAATLQNWANELPAAARTPEQRADIDKLKKFETREVPPATPENIQEGLKYIVENVRRTYEVRLSDGGVYGINGSLATSLAAGLGKLGVPMPVALAAPDVRYLHGRHAVVNVGSAASSGNLFVGSDRRHGSHLGASAVGGLVGAGGRLGGTIRALAYGQDSAAPRGVMVRMRFKTPGPAETNGMETWRAKLIDVIDTVHAGGAARTSDAMWTGLADKFYKDPDLSLNWLDTDRNTSQWSGVGVTGGLTFDAGDYQAGPSANLGVVKTWRARMQRHEQGGKQTLEQLNQTSGTAVTASASLLSSTAPQGVFSSEANTAATQLLPNAPLVGKSCTLLRAQTGVSLRLTSDGGRLDPDLTLRDTEFTNIDKFNQYVDSQRPRWLSTLGGGAEAETRLDEFLTRAKQDALSGKQMFFERRWMTHDAARKINLCDEMLEELRAADPVANRADISRLQKQKANLLQAEESWDCRFLFTLENNTTQRTAGPFLLAGAQRVTQRTHLRQLSVLVAERPPAP